jgi:hypothetical protein
LGRRAIITAFVGIIASERLSEKCPLSLLSRKSVSPLKYPHFNPLIEGDGADTACFWDNLSEAIPETTQLQTRWHYTSRVVAGAADLALRPRFE